MRLVARCLDRVRAGFEFFATYRQHLPLVGEALFSLPCSVVHVRGALRSGDGEATITYVGRRKNYHYLLRMVFSESEIIEEHRRTLLTCGGPFRRLEKTADLLVADLGWPYNGMFNRNRGWMEVPDWVNMELSLDGNWSDVQKRFRQTVRTNDLRRIRRNGYRWDFTTDRCAAEQFYEDMYLPFIRHRYRSESVIEPRRNIVKRVVNGGLLRVFLEDRVVVAGVMYPDGSGLHYLWLGVPREHLENPPDSAMSALYLYGIQHAHEQGLDYVNFTGTRGFLGDGAFRFKKKWGGVVEDTFSPGSVLFKPARSERAISLLKNLPLLARNGQGGLEAVFVRELDGGAEERERLGKDYCCAGVEGITVFQVGDGPPSPAPATSDGFPVRTVACSAQKFPEVFTRRVIARANEERRRSEDAAAIEAIGAKSGIDA